MTEFFFEGESFAIAEQDLDRLAAGLLDLRSYWPLLEPKFLEWMRQQFDSRGAFAGDPWAPLTERYAVYKTQKYGPGKGILEAEGDLRRAALTPGRETTPRTVTFIIDKWGEFKGDDSLDPAWHQEGTDRMPARPILFGGENLPERVRADIEQTAEFYVRDLVHRLSTTLGP